ncbi:G-protein coupled receptor Mth2-like isoform X2 [Neocloeon triangulifer]|uniref:G-protein coupled receptor Mth2-like isoform X2 n=1 Tax=Neocloeon triangulifer TaxID=2078957 RepID=UPI00286ECC88|nr:G-protein coupled receptor Mth2-like isoform X2 [Neocloeon triangulifer]
MENASIQTDDEDPMVAEIQRSAATILYIPMAFMIFSAIMLLIVIVNILKSAEKRSTMVGKIVACQSIALFVGYLLIAVILACLVVLIYKPSEAILALGLIAYFLIPLMGAVYLSSHFWLNVQCFDVFYNFRNIENMLSVVNKDKESHKCRFALYCLYAILLPIIIAVAAFIVTMLEQTGTNKKLTWAPIIFGAPVLIFTVANLIFVGITRRNVSKMRREMRSFDSNTSRAGAISSTWLTIKMLLTTLGITWIFEAILILGVFLEFPPNFMFLIVIICLLRGVTTSVIYLCFNFQRK